MQSLVSVVWHSVYTHIFAGSSGSYDLQSPSDKLEALELIEAIELGAQALREYNPNRPFRGVGQRLEPVRILVQYVNAR